MGQPWPSAAGKRLDGFNEDQIDFEGEKATVLNGPVNWKRYLERWCRKLADVH